MSDTMLQNARKCHGFRIGTTAIHSTTEIAYIRIGTMLEYNFRTKIHL